MSGKNQHWGSTLDDFLHEEGISEAAKEEAAIRASCLIPNNETIAAMKAARRGELVTAGKPDVLIKKLKTGIKTKNKTMPQK